MSDTFLPHDVSLSAILDKVPNKFLLCVAVSKRARQIKDALPISHPEDEPVIPVLDALKEIAEGKITVLINDSIDHGSQEMAKRERMKNSFSPVTEENKDAHKKSKKSQQEVKLKVRAKSLGT